MDIETVKKILKHYFRGIFPSMYHEIAEEICQLVEKEIQELKDDRDDWRATAEVANNLELSRALLEPDPSESRLLGDDEILDKFGVTLSETILNRNQRLREVAKAQDAKTASILDAKYAQEKVDFAGSIYDEAICMARVDCQQKLKRIKERAEERFVISSEPDGVEVCQIYGDEWEAIWKEEGI